MRNTSKEGRFFGKFENVSEIRKSDKYPTKHVYKTEITSYIPSAYEVDLINKINSLNNDKIKIMELGCTSSCRIYHILSRYINKKIEKYFGIDLPDVIEKSVTKNNNVSLTDNIYNINDAIDIFYCNSTLQYVKDPYKMLEHIINLDPSFILFNRTPLTKEKQFVTLQVFNGKKFPYTFFDLWKLIIAIF